MNHSNRLNCKLTAQLSHEIIIAKERIDCMIRKTPLIFSETLSAEYGNEIYLKPENFQLTGSFKIRGSFNKISSLSPEEKLRGVVAASAGNHSQGVALASKKLGVNATLFMPKTTPLIKVEATKSHGAAVVLHGDCYDEAYEAACEFAVKHDAVMIHPFDDVFVMAGQGTIGLEILEELADVDCILVPIGGGGLIAGVAAAIKMRRPDIQIIGVEPHGAMAMKMSVRDNQLTPLSHVKTIADGVAVKTPGKLTFEVSKHCVDDIITVSDHEIMESFCLLLEKHKIVGESAGVLSVAALKHLDLNNKKIVCLLSGGNIDVLTMASMINTGLVSRGRLFCFSVDLPDKPGELAKISQILAHTGANVVKLEHNQFKALDRLTNAVLEVTCETSGHKHIQNIQEEMSRSGYFTQQVF